MNKVKLLYVDLFCGAGGTSTGVELATINGEPCAKVIACVNHDKNAILSHAANHPDALHFTEDIRTLELSPMVCHLEKMRTKYPDAYVVLWASCECTNFSKAKGGMPRDADSRTLAEHLYRYIETLNPDFIQIENVEEFMCWGDLDKNGKPISKYNGKDYVRWCNTIQSYGYNYDWRILNAADFGAYTSRKRFFGLFAKQGLPLAFPTPTYTKYQKENPLFKGLYKKWKPVREVLDLNDEGQSIFERSKPLCEKTLERIYAGLVKFVAGGKEKHDAWILKYNSMNQNRHNAPSIEEPCPTVAVQNRPTKDRLNKVKVSFFDNQYGNGKPSGVEQPALLSCKTPNKKLVTVNQFLMNPYSFKSDGGSIDRPCFTLIARMDKMPPYLISTDEGVAIAIFEGDSPMTIKIKEFMAAYGIADIKMRMLKISELKRIMGFPEDYILVGTQSEQKKYIGNAVEVNMAKALCESLCTRLIKQKRMII